MYNLVFSGAELQKLSTQCERRNWGMKRDELISQIETCCVNNISEGDYEFCINYVNGLYVNGQAKGTMEYFCQDLIVRKIYQNIKRIYNVSQANRNQIVRQVKTIMEDPYPLWVVRLDIKSFYESINREAILNKLKSDRRVNFQTIELLEKLFSHSLIQKIEGLPRGLSISSAIAELFMKYFDLDIQRIDGVYYYARFVDDIIVFCNCQKTRDEVYNRAPALLEKIKLDLNQEKSYIIDENSFTSDKRLNYLGYSFVIKKIGKNRKQKNELLVSIAENKLKIIKTKLVRSFVRFVHDRDYEMLVNRIKYLTGNFTVGNLGSLVSIKSGIYFNYKMICVSEKERQLIDLDLFYNKILHCKKGKFGMKLASLLSKEQIKYLSKFSFNFGFDSHVSHHFHSSVLSKIKKCWL